MLLTASFLGVCNISFFSLKKPVDVYSPYKVKWQIPKLILKAYTKSFNPTQDGGAKNPPTSFFPVTSTNVGINPKNF